MSRKDYKLIARTLASVRRASINRSERRAVEACALALAAALAADNVRFDSERFMAAVRATE